MEPIRKIIHVDMDAFFASIEQRDHPAYRGHPIVVGGRPEQRGAVAAASYEARRYGVHSALPSRIAVQRCPHLIFVPPRFEVYRQVSQQIQTIFHRYTDLIEPLSLDEAYLDVTQNKIDCASAMAIARQIKREIKRETRLTASAGVSVNKFLAKIASDLDKPDGLSLIPPEQAASFVEELPIRQFYGIGQVTAQKMQALGIHTGADLKQWPEESLVRHFGKVGRFYYQVARGQDHRPVNPNRIRKSVGAEQSFYEDLSEIKQMCQELDEIAHQVEQRLMRHQRYGCTLTLKVKYADYQQMTRSCTQMHPFRDADRIYETAKALLIENVQPGAKVRLLGITISNLTSIQPIEYHQLSFPFVESVVAAGESM